MILNKAEAQRLSDTSNHIEVKMDEIFTLIRDAAAIGKYSCIISCSSPIKQILSKKLRDLEFGVENPRVGELLVRWDER